MRALAVCLMIMAITLAGCGRKAELDVPPGGVEDSRVEREWKDN